MKKIENREELQNYIQAYELSHVLNEALLPHLSLYQFDEGEYICEQGDSRSHLYILVKGKVKIYTTSMEGNKLILAFKFPLEIVGDIEYIQDIDMINTVQAVTSVTMIRVHYEWINKYSYNHPPFLQFLLKIITRKFHIKNNSFVFNLMYPVEVRLASYLLSISFDESNEDFNGRLSIHQLKDAAGLIGTSYRHLNRVLNQLCEEGLVERTKEYIFVKDAKRLSALANHNIYE